MKLAVLALALVAVVTGCKAAPSKSYLARAERTSMSVIATGPTLEQVQRSLTQSPRRVHFDGDRFRTTAGDKTQAEGTWKRVNGTIILHIEKQGGVTFQGKAAPDYVLVEGPGGTLLDEKAYAAQRLRLVFSPE